MGVHKSKIGITLGNYFAMVDVTDVNREFLREDVEVMGGRPCFAGTRVPVQTLLDYLDAGDSIDYFLDGFPTVKRKHVIAFLETFSRPTEGY